MNKKTFYVFLSTLYISISSVYAQAVTSDDFVLKNARGQVTARLTTSGEGTPALFFYDENQKVRISIGLYGDGVPGIVLNDDQEKAGAIMRLVSNNGNPVLVLKENGQDKLIIDKNGMPKVGRGSQLVLLISASICGFIGGLVANSFFKKREVFSGQNITATAPVVPSTPSAPVVNA